MTYSLLALFSNHGAQLCGIMGMTISADWVTAVTSVLIALGGLWAWISRQRQIRRDATPIIRVNWHDGAKGFTANIEISNRMSEDLSIIEARAAARFIEQDPVFDSGGSITQPRLRYFSSPRLLDCVVPPGAKGALSLSVDGAETPRWIRLTMSSSHHTLRNEHLTLRDGTTA